MTKDDILKTFRTNVEQIKHELAICSQRTRRSDDCVFVWPKHWLAIKIGPQGATRAVGVADATAVSPYDRRVFTNGNKERAILMPREKALCGALVHAVEILEQWEALPAA